MDLLAAQLVLADHSSAVAVLHFDVENQTPQNVAAVVSIEIQDGMSEPVKPPLVDDAPWVLPPGDAAITEATFDQLANGAYKVEALVSVVDESGDVHGTLAETYLLVEDGAVAELKFDEWLPLVNAVEVVMDPEEPDPEL